MSSNNGLINAIHQLDVDMIQKYSNSNPELLLKTDVDGNTAAHIACKNCYSKYNSGELGDAKVLQTIIHFISNKTGGKIHTIANNNKELVVDAWAPSQTGGRVLADSALNNEVDNYFDSSITSTESYTEQPGGECSGKESEQFGGTSDESNESDGSNESDTLSQNGGSHISNKKKMLYRELGLDSMSNSSEYYNGYISTNTGSCYDTNKKSTKTTRVGGSKKPRKKTSKKPRKKTSGKRPSKKISKKPRKKSRKKASKKPRKKASKKSRKKASKKPSGGK